MARAELFDYRHVTAESVTADLDAGLQEANQRVDELASSPPGTLVDALARLDLVVAETVALNGRTGFLTLAHTDAEVRDSSQEAMVAVTTWLAALPLRDDLAEVLLRLESQQGEIALGEDRRLVQHWMRDLRRNGHGLKPYIRDEVRLLRARLAELEADFQRNIDEHADGLDLTIEELDGMPESFIARLLPGTVAGTRRVTLAYPELQPAMAHCRRRDVRERLMRKDWSRAAETNLPVLTAGLDVRRRLAELLGYPSWAAYATEVQMAGEPVRATSMLQTLRAAIAIPNAARLAELRSLLVEDGAPAEVVVEHWDLAYLERLRTERHVGLDPAALAEYFPADSVLNTMFGLMGDLFGLTFDNVPDPPGWAPEILLREVRDADGSVLGYIHLDLFPRPGKFSHGGHFDLVRPHRTEDGSRRPAVSAVLLNFTPPVEGRPALLRHDEVVGLFHEFGHAVHFTVSNARYARFAGTETEHDFVEAPSQLMERWAWEPLVLTPMARHWQSGQPLDPAVIKRLTASRHDGALPRATMDVMRGLLDLSLHEAISDVDLDQLTRNANEAMGVPYIQGRSYLTAFGHLFGGYDAGYYGYPWAEIIGDDMVERFEREGILSPHVGREFRRLVLEPGGTRPAEELVEAFLGRPADPQSFLRARGWG